MAEGKKSFVAYCDWGDIFDELSDQEAGVLVKHLFDYVRDKNPEPKDQLTKMLFIQIQHSLKRDLEKYSKYIDKQKVNGAKGGRPKKNPEKPKKPKPFLENPPKPKKADSVSVSVNDNVNDILLEKETKELFKVWIDYRKEIKKTIKSDKTLISLAKRIKKEGLDKSKKVITASIENGWQGLFWDKQKETPSELVDGFRNPTNGKININELTKKINGTAN